MLLQTNSYIVPREKRVEHARLMRRFRQALQRIGCEHFEVYEQEGTQWTGPKPGDRFVQILRFRDRKHFQQIQSAEAADQGLQGVIREFCELIDLPWQQEQSLFAAGYYTSVLTGGTEGAVGDASGQPAEGSPSVDQTEEGSPNLRIAPDIESSSDGAAKAQAQ